jgi:phage-related minor tail protein
MSKEYVLSAEDERILQEMKENEAEADRELTWRLKAMTPEQLEEYTKQMAKFSEKMHSSIPMKEPH